MGEAISIELARQGADVTVTDICLPPAPDIGQQRHQQLQRHGSHNFLEEMAERIVALGRRALVLRADISDLKQVQSMIDETVASLGGVDILVNCAATTVGTGPFLDIDEAAWDLTFAVNTKGPFYTMRSSIPYMLQRGGGRIVNILTGLETGGAGYGAYMASKAALASLSRIVAYEYASRHILINTVSPGWITTSMGREEHAWIAEQYGLSSDTVLETVCGNIPRGRDGKAQDVADAVAFLCSPASDYLVAQNIEVDGGYYRGTDAVEAALSARGKLS